MTSPGPTLTCPACARPLREVVHRDVHVDACDCGGMWFDAGEIAAWAKGRNPVGAAVAPPAPSQSDAPSCPRCTGSLSRRGESRSIPFAQCGKCAGVWLPAEAVAKLDPSSPDTDPPDPLMLVIEFVASMFGRL